MENVFDNFGVALVWGEDFDAPVWGDGEGVGNFSAAVSVNAALDEDGDVGDDGAIAKATSQFWKGAGNALGFDDSVDG